jgi:hypothetical protein
MIMVALCFFAVLLSQWLVKLSNCDCPAFMYAWAYHVEPNQVFKSPKPHDCEWRAAPLGDKFCHYEKAIDAQNDVKGKPSVWVGWSKVEE